MELREFGVSPLQLFLRPHQPRLQVGSIQLLFLYPEFCEPQKKTQLPFPLFDVQDILEGQVDVPYSLSILEGHFNGKTIICGLPEGTLIISSSLSKEVFSFLHSGMISRVVVQDNMLFTVGEDFLIGLWVDVSRKPSKTDLMLIGYLIGHSCSIKGFETCRGYDFAVSFDDECVLGWDLNRLDPLFRIAHDSIKAISLCNETGDFLLCTADSVILYDINGQELSRERVEEEISSCFLTSRLPPEQISLCSIAIIGTTAGSVILWHIPFVASEGSRLYKWKFIERFRDSRSCSNRITRIKMHKNMDSFWSCDASGMLIRWTPSLSKCVEKNLELNPSESCCNHCLQAFDGFSLRFQCSVCLQALHSECRLEHTRTRHIFKKEQTSS